MPTSPEQPRPQELQREVQAERPATPERPEPTEADLEKLVHQADTYVDNEEARVLQAADQRTEKVPASIGLEQQKASSIFTAGGFADRIKQAKDKISALTKLAKDKIKGLTTSQPEVIHFKDLAQPQTPEAPQAVTPSVEEQPSVVTEQETPTPDTQEQKVEIEDTAEQKELKDLREYLQAEVYTKFGLTAEDEQKVVAEAPENRREILQRSFENTRASLETFYKMETIDGRIDAYAADKAQKQLNYEVLAPILESRLKELPSSVAALGVEVSADSLGFGSDTADRDKLSSAFFEIRQQIRDKVSIQVEREIEESLLQTGEWQGITLATEEQQRDEEYMQERGDKLQRLERLAIGQRVKSVDDEFSKWQSETMRQVDEPYTMRPEPDWKPPLVDGENFKVRKTKEAVTATLASEKNLAERTNFLNVNIGATQFEKVLSQGGFRDIFSLSDQEREDMRRIIGRGDDFYMNQRRTIEESLGVYNPDKPTVYGTYASQNGHDEKYGGANMYGQIFLKLKPSVDAVFCEGDSMSGGNKIAHKKLLDKGISSSMEWVKSPQARQIAPEHAALVKGMNNLYDKEEIQLGRGLTNTAYLEAHIKGLNLDDIESINIPKKYASGLFPGAMHEGDYQDFIRRLQQDPKWKGKINILENA